jgi:hypothetical protein
MEVPMKDEVTAGSVSEYEAAYWVAIPKGRTSFRELLPQE